MRLSSYCATLHGVAERDLGELACETKGVLLAFVSLDVGDSVLAAVLAVLDSEDREQCSQAWRSLAGLDQDVRERTLAGWRAQAASGLPNGIERLHPSWIEAALASEPPDLLACFRKSLPEGFRSTVAALHGRAEPEAAAASLSPALARELDRIGFGHLAPLCEGATGPLATRLCALSFDELQDEATRIGARTLGQSLVGTDGPVRARAMALAGEPWARVMAEAFNEELSDDQRKAAMGHVAANVHASARTPSERLLDIGLAVLKGDLSAEHAGSLFSVAGRLPAALGRRLLEW